MTSSYLLHPKADLQGRFFTVAPYMAKYPTEAKQGSAMPVVIMEDKKLLTTMKWGIRPKWAVEKGSPFCRLLISKAEIDEEIEKNKFRQDRVSYTRCIIPASESLKDDEDIRGLAGICERWTDDKGNDMSSFALVTVRKNKQESFATIDRSVEDRWLDQNFNNWKVLDSFLS